LRRCLLSLERQSLQGFDSPFGYGLEDADFGERLEMRGVTPKTVH